MSNIDSFTNSVECKGTLFMLTQVKVRSWITGLGCLGDLAMMHGIFGQVLDNYRNTFASSIQVKSIQDLNFCLGIQIKVQIYPLIKNES